jgi:hypothetical protein
MPPSRKKSKSLVFFICIRISRDFKVGDAAPLAHQQVRAFPDWYKPWTYNYTSDGYMALFFGVIALFGYSYMNDIKEQKGRTYRKTFKSSLPTFTQSISAHRHAADRIQAGDANWTKYTHKKERAAVHHH